MADNTSLLDALARANEEANALVNRAEAAERQAARFKQALEVIATDTPPPWMSANYQQYARDVLDSWGGVDVVSGDPDV